MNGGRLADAEFPATVAGYARLSLWLRSFGRLHAVGVEGTGSYGAGLAAERSDAPGHTTKAKPRPASKTRTELIGIAKQSDTPQYRPLHHDDLPITQPHQPGLSERPQHLFR